jgi:hypothetical protein
MFMNAREPVLEAFADMSPRPIESPQAYLEGVEAVYEHDAYNSLSIEGYRVTPALIEKIRSGSWNPDGNPEDREQVAAMAAKGYLEAFRMTKQSIQSGRRSPPLATSLRRSQSCSENQGDQPPQAIKWSRSSGAQHGRNGQEAGICTRTVSFTGRDAARYTTILSKWCSHVDLHHELPPSQSGVQN